MLKANCRACTEAIVHRTLSPVSSTHAAQTLFITYGIEKGPVKLAWHGVAKRAKRATYQACHIFHNTTCVFALQIVSLQLTYLHRTYINIMIVRLFNSTIIHVFSAYTLVLLPPLFTNCSDFLLYDSPVPSWSLLSNWMVPQ